MTPQAAAERAAEAVRVLNHLTRPGVARSDPGLDVVDVYDIASELALLASRLPQALGQLETLVDQLVEEHQVEVVDGPHHGDPIAAAAVAGHWLAVARAAAGQLAAALDHTQQTLASAAVTPRPSSS